jgi:hypothetical protein
MSPSNLASEEMTFAPLSISPAAGKFIERRRSDD